MTLPECWSVFLVVNVSKDGRNVVPDSIRVAFDAPAQSLLHLEVGIVERSLGFITCYANQLRFWWGEGRGSIGEVSA